MAESSKTIPLEIWMRVFEHMEDPSDLCQCRLVCKSWDYIAETALFASNLCVEGIENVSKMYNHLVKKPKRAHLIRYLQLVCVNGDEPEVQLLLRIAFTTTMEILEGEDEDEFSVMRSQFFITLVDIVESAPLHSHFSIRRLVSCDTENPNFAKAAYAFRNTLERLWTSLDGPCMQPIFDQLKEFTQLRHLNLNKYAPLVSLDDLDAVLRHCNKLEKLNLWIHDTDIPPQTTAAIEEWIKAQHVQQVGSLEYLETETYDPSVIQYLAYKYPNVVMLKCLADDYQDGTFYPLVNAAKTMKHLRIELFVTRFDEIKQVLQDLRRIDDKRASLHADITYSAMRAREDIYAEIDFDLVNDPTKQSRLFQLCITYDRMTSLDSLALLDQLGGCNNAELKLETLNFDATNHDGIPGDIKEKIVLNAIDIIDRLPTVSQMLLAIHEIQYTPCDLTDPPSWIVEKLDIRNANIDWRVFEQISQCSPYLETISIKDCCTMDEQQAPQDIFTVHMPHSSLQTMTIESGKRPRNRVFVYPNCHEAVVDRLLSTKIYFVHINLSAIDTQVYFACSTTQKVVIPTLEIFESLSSQITRSTIKITVADLKKLKIYLGHVEASFDVEKYVTLDKLNKDMYAYALEIQRGNFMNGDIEAMRRRFEDYRTRWNSLVGDSTNFNDFLFS